MISAPTAIFAYLSGVLALVFWLSTVPRLQKVFKVMPPVLWAYFVPMFGTTVGITPASSVVYDWMTSYLLPFALFLLMVTVDLPAILRLGGAALTMMLAGTAGIVIGGPISYFLFEGFFPADAWKGFAALSGTWIGGTANMVAIAESVGTPDALLGPIIVVDTVVGYGWMGLLIALSAVQDRFDRWVGADTAVIERLNKRMEEMDTTRRPAGTAELAIIIGLAMVAAVLSIAAGNLLPEVGDPQPFISHATWGILIAVTAGLLLSFTGLRRLEETGASRVGYVALYLLLTSIGAKADLAAVIDVPMYLVAGALWISIHIAILFAVARIIRAPLFFVATGSMANVGGAASAPIVASVYLPALAPVGLLMGVAGYILGIYAALGCAWLLMQVAAL